MFQTNPKSPTNFHMTLKPVLFSFTSLSSQFPDDIVEGRERLLVNETLPSCSLRTPFLVAPPPNSPSSYFRFCNQKMKASSLPNLNRDTTSFPNFFTLFQDPNNLDDTTLNKHPNIDHSQDTEASETSPFKDIPSPFVSFNEMNENHYPVGGSFHEWDWDQMDQTLPRWPPSPNGSDTNVSVGSNQFSSVSSNDGARMEEVWTTITSYLIDDGHAWRKYGQKLIPNARHPRNYYRCTHRHDQGCPATKQVQRTEEDPLMFQITYRDNHSCKDQPAPLFPESVPLDANC